MLGTIVNSIAILLGSSIGLIFKKGIPSKYKDIIMHSVGLGIILIGLMNAIKTEQMLLLIISLVTGSCIGQFIDIESKLDDLGNWVEKKLSSTESKISKGLVTASLLFCVGSMAIVGALESGLTNNHQTLFTKSVLDGITSIILTSSLGVGVMISSISVFIYQGFITITASFIKPFLTAAIINEMSAIGGLLIFALGLNVLEIKRIKVGNMLPAVFMPLIFYFISSLFS